METGVGICKVVVEFATANRNFLSNIAITLDEEEEVESGVDVQHVQQSDAIDMMHLVLVCYTYVCCILGMFHLFTPTFNYRNLPHYQDFMLSMKNVLRLHCGFGQIFWYA